MKCCTVSTVCTVQRQCCAGVELSLGNNSRWPGSVLAGLGLDTGQYSPHTHITLSTLPPFVTLLYGIYQQYLHISHSIISLSSSHTRTQRDKQVSIRQQVIFCISYVTASSQCSSDMMVSVAERGSGVLSLLSPSSSQCLLQAGCQTADNETAEWRASSHHHTSTSTILSSQPRHGYQGLVSQ